MVTAQTVLRDKGSRVVFVSRDSTIYQAAELMRRHRIGSVLIFEGGEPIGIYTERDLLRNITEPNFDPKTAPIGVYMSTSLYSVPENTSIYEIMDRLLSFRIRHMLVKDNSDHFVGLLSSGDIMRACLNDTSQENDKLRRVASLNYYEHWRRQDTAHDEDIRTGRKLPSASHPQAHN